MLLLKDTTESLQVTTGTTGTTAYQFPSDSLNSNGSSYNDSADLNLGFLAAVTTTVTATGMRYYSPIAGISVTPTIYNDTTNAVVATGPTVLTQLVGWSFLPFSAPVTLSPGIDYVPTVFVSGGRYNAVSTASPYAFPLNDGVMYNTINSAARFLYSSAAKPTNGSTSAIYAVDVVLTGPVQQTAMPTRKGYTYVNNFAGNTLTIAPDSTISVGDWMVLVWTSYDTAGAITDPPGWTVLQSSTTVGTLKTAIYAKLRTTSDTSYNVTVAANGNADGLTLMWGSGAAPIASWIIGANKTRASITPTTTTNNVAPSITTTVPNTLALAISTERTTTIESGPVSMSGATQWGFTPQYSVATNLQTTTVGYINKVGVGATGDATIVYPITQTTNGMAIQIGIPPTTGSLSFSASFTDSTAAGSTKSSSEGIISSATTTTVVASPATSTNRLARMITIVNTDPYFTSTLLLQKNIASTLYNLTPTISLLAGEMIQYLDKTGWTYYASNGTIKGNFSVASAPLTPQIAINNAGTISGATANITTTPTWSQATGSGVRPWSYDAITITPDGKKIFVGTTQNLYDTQDSGTTWYSQASSQTWTGIVGSADGTKYVAIANNTLVQTSFDGGNTFVGQTSAGSRTWKSIAASSDVSKVVICAAGYPNLFTSTDYGVTWTEQTNSNSPVNHQAVASSADGTILLDSRYNSYLYISTDSGVTWNQSGSPQKLWLDVAMSANGTIMAAVADQNKGIYVSYNSGATWTQVQPDGGPTWEMITMSASGTQMIATADDYPYISNDSGVTWTQQSSLPFGNWVNAAITPDGTKAAVSRDTGYIYTYNLTSASSGLNWSTSYSPSKSHSLSLSAPNASVSLTTSQTSSGTVVFDAAGKMATANATSWTHTCTGKNLALIVALTYGIVPAASVTTNVFYNSLPMTKLRRQNSGGTDQGFVEIWYLVNPPIGTYNVTWSSSGTGATVLGASASFTGVLGGSNVFSGFSTASTTTSVTATGATPGSVAIMLSTTANSFTGGNGTQIALINATTTSGAGNLRMSYQLTGSETQDTMTSTMTTGDSGYIAVLLTPTADPLPPASNILSVYSQFNAGMPFPTIQDASNYALGLQSSFYQRNISTWYTGPSGGAGVWTNLNGGAGGGTFGLALPTMTNTYTTMRRITFSSLVTTTNQQVGLRSDANFFLGTMPNQGGFLFVCRFGFEVMPTAARAFIGLASAQPINAEVSSFPNILGFGFDSTDNAISFMHNSSTGTATKEPIVGQGTLATNNTGYDAYIYSPPNSTKVYYRLDRINDGVTLVDSYVTTNLPVPSTPLLAVVEVSNATANTTVGAVVLGVNKIYIESVS